MTSEVILKKSGLYVSRIIIGSVFIFSGFVKGIDPLGSAYKFEDYFTAFGLSFLQPVALPLAILLAAAEFLIGISLVLRIHIRTGIWGAIIFMIFFTPLTLLLALTNPVSDCGCFGDALVITNWQTFWKNIVLLGLILILFLSRRDLATAYLKKTEWILSFLFLLFIFSISTYGLKNLPILDFRPYRIGISIPESMVIPEGVPQDEYETTLIYEKDGTQKEFTSDNFPWKDTTWKFIDQNSVLIKEGYKPPIHDFNILTPEGDEITDIILNDPGYTFLLVSKLLKEAKPKNLERANKLALACKEKNIRFYGVSASGNKEIQQLHQDIDLDFPVYSMDETTLKTIIRSNPGLVLLKKGIILGKWSAKNIPGPEFVSKDLLSQQLLDINKNREKWTLAGILLICLLLLTGFRQIKS